MVVSETAIKCCGILSGRLGKAVYHSRKERVYKHMKSLRTADILKGTVVELNNGWLVKTDGELGEYHPEFIPIEKININGELIDLEHSTNRSLRDFLKKELNMPDDSFAYVPSFDIKYAFLEDVDGDKERCEVYLTEYEQTRLKIFNKIRGIVKDETDQ